MEKYEFKRKDGSVKQYDYISEFKEGFAAVRLNQKWGFIDEDGNEICPIKYEFPTLFCEGYAGVGIHKGKYFAFGYIDTKGNEACEFVYRYVCDFQENG